MPDPTAADIAALIDPDHEVGGWWRMEGLYCSTTGMPMNPDNRGDCYEAGDSCSCCGDGAVVHCETTYTGPPDLHTAREHAWRMEEFILKQTHHQYAYAIERLSILGEAHTNVWVVGNIIQDTNHSAALCAAVMVIGGEK